MIITIPGNPIAKKRPRFARRGKFVTTYSDQQTEEGKTYLVILEQIRGKQFQGPLDVSFTFSVPRPKAHCGTGKKAGVLKSSAPKYPTSKPDVDNYLKFYMDVLNGLAWDDDCQVVRVEAQKIYAGAEGPNTMIILRYMEG